MSQPGCGIVFSPSQRIDRRNSLRRSFILGKRRTTDRSITPVSSSSGQCNDSHISHHSHSRSLSDKMRRIQMRNKKEQHLQQPLAALKPAPSNVKRPPKHMDLLEAASQADCESLRKPSPAPEYLHVAAGKENTPMASSQRTQPRPYNGDGSYRHLAYKQYMSNAFGLDGPGSRHGTPLAEPRRPAIDHRPESDASALTTDSMEVNFHIASDVPVPPLPSARDRRPKIQVQIPGKQTPIRRPTSTAHLATQIDRQKSRRKLRQSQQVSPPTDGQNNETPARLSIVSPLSVVEMPKPRRPFSALSLEDMTQTQNPNKTKAESSDSSDTAKDDDHFSAYTRRSSMSSLTSVATVQKPLSRRHSIAFSIADPVAAGVFDTAPPVPKIASSMRAMRSTTSLALNTNKPLPPEPAMEEVRPLRLPSQSYSRGSDLHPKRKAPSPLNISRSSTVSTIHPNRKSSLRSRYTPADLDALDAAFVKSSPQVSEFGKHTREASWEQAQNALEEHLDTIAEDDSTSSVMVPLACDPLQISRVTNEMVPTRQAPAPPSSTASMASIKLSDGSVSSRKRLHKQPSKHVATQLKADHAGGDLRSRISAPVSFTGNLAKANKILGKDCQETPKLTGSVQMEREGSNESNWSASESPDDSYHGDSSSPNGSNRGDTTTPETDISSIPDHAFEEIKTRMELLSPKNDSPRIHETWGHSEASQGLSRQVPTTGNDEPATSDADSETLPHIQVTPSKDDSEAEVSISMELEAALAPSHSPGQRRIDAKERPRSLASIAASEIPDIYAELPASEDASDEDRMISADAAEIVLLRILEHLDNLQDLFATATVSRGFYRTFKRHELPLMKNALYGMSPAAWELREVTQPYPDLQDGSQSPLLDYSPTVYLQHYMRDMYTMIALKSMILIHCESFLRADTISALAGGETERASQIDDAFWRVWTFCQIFGCGANREDDIASQMDWLRGGPIAKKEKLNKKPRRSLVYAPAVTFGHGNAHGLSAEELYDMTEIWTCMGVLVRGFQGKRQEARDHGVFDNALDLIAGDVEAEDAILEEWTYHLLTLAPPTVLDVTSPTSPTAATFAHAKSRGYTAWTPPNVSRATFLKEAVSRVYQERIAEAHSSAPTTPTRSPASSISSGSSVTSTSTSPEQASPDAAENPSDTVAARWRVARHAAEIRAIRSQPGFDKLPPSEDRPMSNYPSVLEKLDGPITAAEDAPPMPSLPATTFSADQKPAAEPQAAPAATTVKKSYHKPSASVDDTSKSVISALVVPKGPQVRDPVDVAVERLVAMGFESKKAKKALADSDTGNTVNFDVALESLVRERKRDVEGLMHAGYRGNVRERMRCFEDQPPSAGLGFAMSTGTPGGRPVPYRVGSVRRLASQMERRVSDDGCENGNGVGLGIGGL